MGNQTGHSAELLQKANELLKAALHENKVKQLALDAFSDQLSAHQTHIASLNTIILSQQTELSQKEARIVSLNTTVNLLQQNTTDQSAQLAFQQQLIDKMTKATKEDQKKLERQDKELAKLEAIRHGRNLLAKDKFGRRSEKTHTKPVIPDALLARHLSEKAKARLKDIFDNTGYAVYEKKSRKCDSLEAQGVPVETVIIDVDTSKLPEGYIRIGENISRKVVYVKARMYIKRYVQYAYLVPDLAKGDTYYKNVSAPMPDGLLRNKCSADVTLMVQLLVDKYLYGMPIYRQNQVFEQAGARLPHSSMYDWTAKACKAMSPLYEIMLREMIKSGFIHMDETGMLVIDKQRIRAKSLTKDTCWP